MGGGIGGIDNLNAFLLGIDDIYIVHAYPSTTDEL